MAADERAAFVAGLREVADLYEANPELQAPYQPNLSVIPLDAESYAAQCRSLGGKRAKTASDDLIKVARSFGPVVVEVIAMRSEVCERRQVGTKVEMKTDPDAPLVPVEVPVYEYECKPVLAPEAAG